ncbi:MAG: hypothetical protein IE916_05810 [Epsilonproteobacteria bacterium]|nr:hypothetical protein [Campylobacterota bacterium]
MKRLIFLLLPLFLFAQMLQVGDAVVPITLTSQHEKEQKLNSNGKWVVTWDKESTRLANEYFAKFHMPRNVQMIVDVSQVPSGIFNLFVLPNMRNYSHAILLSYDETYNATLPYQEGFVTILTIKESKILKIDFAEDEASLKELLK